MEGQSTYNTNVVHCSSGMVHHVVQVFPRFEESKSFAEGEFATIQV